MDVRTVPPSTVQNIHYTQDGPLNLFLRILPPVALAADGSLHLHIQLAPRYADPIQADPTTATLQQRFVPNAQASNLLEHNVDLAHPHAQFHALSPVVFQPEKDTLILSPPPPPTNIHIPQRSPQRPLPQAQVSPIATQPLPQTRHVHTQLHTQTHMPHAEHIPQPQPLGPVPVVNRGHFHGLKLISSPPKLAEWRERLFRIDDPIVMTEEDFQIYWPHVDNFYSHRSTQRHKTKNFVSHYFDCRFKGRPPGTRKSTDPNKKKRKRIARDRDLCHVKIKVTEHQDIAEVVEQVGGMHGLHTMAGMPGTLIKYYRIERVTGSGNNGEGKAEVHQHGLEDSDRIKKSSVARWLLDAKGKDLSKTPGM